MDNGSPGFGHNGVLSTGHQQRWGSRSLVEFQLAIQVGGKCDGWGSGGQADAVEVGDDRARLGEGGDDGDQGLFMCPEQIGQTTSYWNTLASNLAHETR